jgi:hypothetical protein
LNEAGLKNVSAEETIAGIEDRFLELMEKGVKVQGSSDAT